MIYRIENYKNIFGVTSPILVAVTGIYIYSNAPFIEKTIGADISIFLDNDSIRAGLLRLSTEKYGDFSFISPIETKHVDIPIVSTFLASDVLSIDVHNNDMDIISIALDVQKDKIEEINIENLGGY